MLNDKDLRRIKELKTENSEFNYLFTALEDDHKLTLSGVSHELRNSLTLILSSMQFMESLHSEVLDFKYWKETTQDLHYMKSLLLNLSDYNNSDTLKLKSFDLGELMTHIHTTCSSWTLNSNITFNFTSSDNLPIIIADPIKLQQAFINLIKNAFEAVTSDGTISLDIKKSGDFIIISITDNGCGITESQSDTIFTPFTTYKPNGTGLGLPVTRRIIEAHNGIIQITNAQQGGTVVTIILPNSSSGI